MKRQEIQGSKPRKFVTRTILTNPSLISVSVTSILDPENHSLPKIYNALQKRQEAVAQFEQRIRNQISPSKFSRQASLQQRQTQSIRPQHMVDSLQQAEQQFITRKLSQPQVKVAQKPQFQAVPTQNKHQNIPKQISQLSRGSSTPSLMLNNSFHYKNTRQIVQKQSKAYNIISNF